MQGVVLFPGGRGASVIGLAPLLPFDRLFDKAMLRGSFTGDWAVVAAKALDAPRVLGIFCETQGGRLLYHPQPTFRPTEGPLIGRGIDHFTMEISKKRKAYQSHATSYDGGRELHSRANTRRVGNSEWALRDPSTLPVLPERLTISVEPHGDPPAFAKRLFGTATCWLLSTPPSPPDKHLRLTARVRHLLAGSEGPSTYLGPVPAGEDHWRLGSWEVVLILHQADGSFESLIARPT